MDNEPDDKVQYCLAIFTSIRSTKHLSSTVFLTLNGEKATTDTRMIKTYFREVNFNVINLERHTNSHILTLSLFLSLSLSLFFSLSFFLSLSPSLSLFSLSLTYVNIFQIYFHFI